MISSENRLSILGRAWLSPGAVWFGSIQARPFSLGSLLLIEELGMRDLEGDPAAFGSLYCWAHSEPLDRVLWEIRRGSWREAWAKWEFDIPVQPWSEVGLYLESIGPEIEAAQVEIKEREKGEGCEDDPPEVIEPHYIASYVSAISDVVRAMPDKIVWLLPVGQAFQLIHAALRKARAWTVPPGTKEAAKQAASVAARELETEFADELAAGWIGGDEFEGFAALEELENLI